MFLTNKNVLHINISAYLYVNETSEAAFLMKAQ